MIDLPLTKQNKKYELEPPKKKRPAERTHGDVPMNICLKWAKLFIFS